MSLISYDLMGNKHDKVQTAIDRLHAFEPEDGYYLAFSGGKDSQCIYHLAEMNGLKQEWTGVCWMNPPYGREIGKWVKKAYESAEQNLATVVCLLPARTDTAWFHDYALRGQIDFVRGRLKFGGAKNSAPFPSMVVTFYPKVGLYRRWESD